MREVGVTPPAPGRAPGKCFCSMCGGVESDTPGACPKCGMALERAAPVQTARHVRHAAAPL